MTTARQYAYTAPDHAEELHETIRTLRATVRRLEQDNRILRAHVAALGPQAHRCASCGWDIVDHPHDGCAVAEG